jgi:predicted small metal-binding protein
MDTLEHQPQGQGKMNFRCSDVGPKTCDWQVSGNSEQEIMPKIEQHGREKHNLTMDNETRNKVRSAIQRKAA